MTLLLMFREVLLHYTEHHSVTLKAFLFYPMLKQNETPMSQATPHPIKTTGLDGGGLTTALCVCA